MYFQTMYFQRTLQTWIRSIAMLCILLTTAAGAASGTDWDDLRRRLDAGADVMEIVAELRGPVGPGDEELCSPLPSDGLPGLTNDRFYFLSEILEGEVPLESPGCGDQLACFLKQVPGSVHSNATLIVDRQCVVDRSLTIPDRFTLAGVGIGGEGILVFDLPNEGTALRFPSVPEGEVHNRLSALRDLTIASAGCCGQVGLEIGGSGYVDLDRVQITGFAIGVLGDAAYSISIDQSRIFGNGFNVVLGDDTTAWRIRESTLSQAFLAGLVFGPEARGNLISGGRMESNLYTGVLVHGPKNTIEHTWFEGNGGASNDAIKIAPFSYQNRILSNLFASDEISNSGTDNQICFSITSLPLDNCSI